MSDKPAAWLGCPYCKGLRSRICNCEIDCGGRWGDKVWVGDRRYSPHTCPKAPFPDRAATNSHSGRPCICAHRDWEHADDGTCLVNGCSGCDRFSEGSS